MTQQTGKPLHNVCLALGVFFLTVVVVVGITLLSRSTWIDQAPKQWLSREIVPKELISEVNKETPKNPEAATKEAYEKVIRELQERSNAPQSQQDWDHRWKK